MTHCVGSAVRWSRFLPRAAADLGRRGHIVILDDRETNRKIFSKLAASIESGVTGHSFGNPVELLAWLENNTPDLVVTYFKMPSMDGAQFICRLRALPHCGEIPVIVNADR